MNVSIIVVTRNRAPLLELCLNKLSQQVQPNDEIIVVDNASKDNTASIIKSLNKKIPICYVYEPRRGASYARNRGFRIATKQGVAFIDDDSLIKSDWLNNLRSILHTRALQNPNVVYQGKITQYYRHQGLYEHLRLRDFQQDLIRVGMLRDTKNYSSIRSLIAANMFSYRSVFKKLHGPFNARLFPFIGEDPDLAYRCIRMGLSIVYAPHVHAIHTKLSPVTLRDSLLAAYKYGRATALFERLYFTDTRFLFRYYARTITEGKENHGRLKTIDTFTWRHPFVFLQARLFYTLTSTASAVGRTLYKRFPINLDQKR